MAKICYLQCLAGASGDMLLAAALDAGASLAKVQQALVSLNLPGVELSVSKVMREGIATTKIEVLSSLKQQFRHLKELLEIVEGASLSPWVKDSAASVFMQIAKAEAKVHGCTLQEVHFHEVGAVDTIVDVVGVLVAFESLAVDTVIVSPLPQPSGFVQCAHGKIPLPAPAVCEILRGAPCYGVDVESEMVTPTGAALLRELARDFGPMPELSLLTIGYGSGSREYSGDIPNFLRLFLGEENSFADDEVEVIETHIDDATPEHLSYLLERLFAVGAVDVVYAPVMMKKGRPAQALTVLAPPQYGEEVRQTIFRESTTIGLRYRTEKRQILPRREAEIPSPWGVLLVKEVFRAGSWQKTPEFDVCKRVAKEFSLPLIKIYDYVRGFDNE